MGLRGVKLYSRFSIILGCLISLAFIFQNCTTGGGATGGVSDSDLQKHGNGTGYGGMVYVNFLLTSTCPDGTNINNKVLFTSDTEALMLRENCMDIAPKPATPEFHALNFAGMTNEIDVWAVGGRVYQKAQDAAITTLFCHRITPIDPFKSRTTDIVIRSLNGIQVGAELASAVFPHTTSIPQDQIEDGLILSSPSHQGGDTIYSGMDTHGGHYVLTIHQNLIADIEITPAPPGSPFVPISISETEMGCYTP